MQKIIIETAQATCIYNFSNRVLLKTGAYLNQDFQAGPRVHITERFYFTALLVYGCSHAVVI